MTGRVASRIQPAGKRSASPGPAAGAQHRAAAGSQSPEGPRAGKPRVGWQIGRASAPAGGQGLPSPYRSPGLSLGRRPGIGRIRQPPNTGQGRGHRHTPRLGRGSGAALKAGTDDAPDQGGAQEPPLTNRAQQPPGRARVGLQCTDGPCPGNAKDGLGLSCGRFG